MKHGLKQHPKSTVVWIENQMKILEHGKGYPDLEFLMEFWNTTINK